MGGLLLDSLLYGLLLAPFAIACVALMVRAFDDCYSIEDEFGNTTELHCPEGAIDGGALTAGIIVGVAGLLVVAILYLRALAKTGQTWGRRLAGVKVVNANTGEPPGWGKAIGRSLFERIISGQLLFLGYLWMLWDKNKQTWHDKVAGTIVIKV